MQGTKIKEQKNSGNALFLILIAVALFAALSYAITQSGRGGGSVEKETVMIAGAQITQYLAQLEQTINRMRIVNGCDVTDLSFDNTVLTATYTPVLSGGPCDVFHENGGGADYISPKSEWLDSSESASSFYGDLYFLASSRIPGVGSAAANSTSNDLMVIIPWVTEEICREFNRSLGYTPPFGNAGFPEAGQAYSPAWAFDGTIPGVSDDIQTSGGELTGVYTACIQGASANPAGGYHIYQVLYPR